MSMQADGPGPSQGEADLARDAGTLLQMITGYWVTQVVRAAADLSVMDHVADGAATAGEVAARESSNPRTTYRLMRACASLGLLSHEGQHRFAVTPLGTLLRGGVPFSMRDLALVMGAHGHWQSWGLLPEAVRAGTPQFETALGMTTWDYFDKNPAEWALFASAMSELTQLLVADVLAAVDVTGVSVAVDVGGANGALVQAFMRANPGLRGIVLDRPNVVPGAVLAAEKAGLADRFTGHPGDFFQEVPAADLYLLKLILHDWDDESCRTLLRNCRAAARPGARMVVVETVIGELGTPDPGPLADMDMLAVPGGEERDIAEYDMLFAASGWQRVAVHATRSPLAAIELKTA
jgi:hypothetical protein